MVDELHVALEAAEVAGAILMEHLESGVTVEWKGPRDPVTPADREAEDAVRQRIAAACPDDVVVGEEGRTIAEADVRGRRRWYVDPLDGTMNFIKSRRRFAVAIGFCGADDKMAVGVVYAPALGDTYLAERGGGATLEGRRIERADVDGLGEAMVSIGSLDGDMTAQQGLIGQVSEAALSIRVDGSAVLDLCDVATGRSDAFWTSGSERWDLAAGALIAQEAGALVTDLAGNTIDGPSREAIAAAPGVHTPLLALVGT